MSSNIRTINSGQNNIVPAGASGAVVDHWSQVAAVAQPTLDMIVKLRPARDWLEDRRKNYRTVLINVDRAVEQVEDEEAKERLGIVPELAVLQDAAMLFDDAVSKAPPAGWFALALGAMLRGMPNAASIAADYTFNIVDMLVHGDVLDLGCQPAFSAPIFVCALRKVRSEQKFVPSAAEILEACQHYRKRFKELANDVETLMMVRENAEQVVSAVEIALKEPSPFDGALTAEEQAEYERALQQTILENKRAGYVYVEIPDEDLPF
jgi:hypothetical protein